MESPEIPRSPPRVGLLYDERMCRHTTPDGERHPECPERIRAIWKKLEAEGIPQRCVVLNSKRADEKHLASVHTKKHIDMIRSISSKEFDSRRLKIASKFNSIYFNNGSSEAAYLAAGSVVEASVRVARGELNSGVAIVRPPGHHSESNEAMGFCLFNNVAIAANVLLDKRQELGIKKILIVDWDVHHGNGTQKAFYYDPRVLFFSVHRFDFGSFYPTGGDGAHFMTGEDAGAGYNINVPWEHGRCGDADYFAVWDHVLMPVAEAYNPDIILISAGFDAAIGDPLGGCCISPFGYSVMLLKLMRFAGGKIVMALEGGYNLNSISNSVFACVKTLLEEKPIYGILEDRPFKSTWSVIQEVRNELKTFWPILSVELPQNMSISNNQPLPVEVLKKAASPARSRTCDTEDSDNDLVTPVAVVKRLELCSTVPALTGVETKTQEGREYYKMETEYERVHTPPTESAVQPPTPPSTQPIEAETSSRVELRVERVSTGISSRTEVRIERVSSPPPSRTEGEVSRTIPPALQQERAKPVSRPKVMHTRISTPSHIQGEVRCTVPSRSHSVVVSGFGAPPRSPTTGLVSTVAATTNVLNTPVPNLMPSSQASEQQLDYGGSSMDLGNIDFGNLEGFDSHPVSAAVETQHVSRPPKPTTSTTAAISRPSSQISKSKSPSKSPKQTIIIPIKTMTPPNEPSSKTSEGLSIQTKSLSVHPGSEQVAVSKNPQATVEIQAPIIESSSEALQKPKSPSESLKETITSPAATKTIVPEVPVTSASIEIISKSPPSLMAEIPTMEPSPSASIAGSSPIISAIESASQLTIVPPPEPSQEAILTSSMIITLEWDPSPFKAQTFEAGSSHQATRKESKAVDEVEINQIMEISDEEGEVLEQIEPQVLIQLKG